MTYKHFLTALFALLALNLQAQTPYDTFCGSWVCNDALGRPLAQAGDKDVPASPQKDALVGMFYYLWQGQHGAEVKDNTRLLQENVADPQFGGDYQYHWGGKPALGFYAGGDSFIIAKHMQMLMDAGVDFYFFDVTNAVTYDGIVKKVMAEVDRRKALGLSVPRLCFMTHSATESTVKHLYDAFFSRAEYDRFWFIWQGKPLILVERSGWQKVAPAIRSHFTARFSWAWETGKKQWPWLSFYPQKPGYIIGAQGDTIIEQISVGTAQHPYSKIGKSYHEGKEPAIDSFGLCKETPFGLYFQEQWREALRIRPKVVMVTQWNEWIAQRFPIKKPEEINYVRPGAVGKIGESYFVDVYNQEFNRDIEPSSEPLVKDNYYLQLVSNIRRYKGLEEPATGNNERKIHVAGPFSQWNAVTQEFRDEPGDCDFTSRTAQKAETFLRKTNDIVLCKVVQDKKHLYFYAKTAKEILQGFGPTFCMTLFINSDSNYATGWNGYDFIVENGCLYHYNKGWQKTANLKDQLKGCEIMFALNKKDLEMTTEQSFDFKWADNVPRQGLDIMDFYANGDAAPNGRFNYRFQNGCKPQ